MIIADSDVLIDGLRGNGESVKRVAVEIERGSLATTVISVFELLAGAKTDQEREKVERLLGALAILPLDDGAAREAAQVRHELGRLGRTIGTADLLIAGICIAHSGILLTRNRAHFDGIPRLTLGELHA
jgi:predicted nucleic acid-binding protein